MRAHKLALMECPVLFLRKYTLKRTVIRVGEEKEKAKDVEQGLQVADEKIEEETRASGDKDDQERRSTEKEPLEDMTGRPMTGSTL